jgi:hypothetical protein
MPIKLNYVSAVMSNYLINFQGQNYSVIVNHNDSKIKIQQPTGNFKRWHAIKNAVLNYHQSNFSLN